MAPYNFLYLPNYACQYCGIHDPNCIVQCADINCNRWFCNTKYRSDKHSHIMMHVQKSRHFSIRDYNGSLFECECREKNIYKLKKDVRKGYIACEKCIILYEGTFNKKKYSPFIQEGRIPYGWIYWPRTEDYDKMIILKPKDIETLEDLWKEGYLGRFEILKDLNSNDNLIRGSKMKDMYNDLNDYEEVMLNLLTLHEYDDEKKSKDYYQDNVTLKVINEKKILLMDCSNYDYFSGNLKKGTFLQIIFETANTDFIAKIKKIDNKINKIECDLLKSFDFNGKKNFKVNVKLVWNNISFRRMATAILNIRNSNFFMKKLQQFFGGNNKLEQYSTRKNNGNINTNFIENKENTTYHISKREDSDGNINIDFIKNKENATLNISQREAINQCLKSTPLTLIQGPPGTGKTCTLYEIIRQYHLHNLNLPKTQKKLKILVCAPSNIAVDNLASKLKKNNINTVRVYSKIREESNEIEEEVREISLHIMVQKLTGIINNYELSHEDYQEYFDTEIEILGNTEIICCTSCCAGDKRLPNFKFDCVIIDEAAQGLEIETLIPISLCTEKLILCGDHKQLGPLVFSKLTKTLGLGVSMFERLTKIIKPCFLETQYRMHEKISEYPSNAFYEGKLKTGVIRDINGKFPWPCHSTPQLFCHIEGKEEVGSNGKSYLNREEADFITDVVNHLIQAKVLPKNIVIITPYLAQKHFLMNEEKVHKDVIITSVDGFQGREEDYIIISCVRSNKEMGIGFLQEVNRINVSLTRAKLGMIICGNAKTLIKNEDWRSMLEFYSLKRVLVSGEEVKQMKIYNLE